MQIKHIGDSEYAESICRYFAQQFPKVAHISKTDLLEILTDILLGTKETRYGPIPKPEEMVVIRDTIRKAIEANVPIPLLALWGGRKTTPSEGIDVAELIALRQILNVDELVKQYFAPGLHIHVRIEDLGAKWLWRTEGTDEFIDAYSKSFAQLIEIMKGSTHIEPILESSLMDETEYFKASEAVSEVMEDVITKYLAFPDIDIVKTPEFQKLRDMGWKGDLPKEQVEFYMHRYKDLYPHLTPEHYVLMLSDYFGGSKARYDLDGRGEPSSSIESFLQMSFLPPIPGAPKSLNGNTLYWRSMPASNSRSHIAPWRGKGYLKIGGSSGEVKGKIVSWRDEIIKDLQPFTLEIGSKEASVKVKADYIVI